MKQFFRTLIVLMAALLIGFLPLLATARAEGAADGRALVVIRFNQERVYFDQQLYSAVSKAVAAKPEVLFEVVSFSPATGQPQADGQWQAAASNHTQTVVASLQSMGVPASRIQVRGQMQPGLRYDETHVFVR